ncbi:MAG: hypothetical protein Hens2KO_27870 [Henriciella sp.]
MRRNIIIGAASIGLLSFGGCETSGISAGNAIGAAIGGGLGYAACQLSGANDTECALLVIAGAAAGYGISEYLDERDKDTYAQATQQALAQPDEAPVVLVDEDTNNKVTITPTSAPSVDGRPCKENQVEYIKFGEPVSAKETWCQQEDGSWAPQTGT